LLGLVGVRRGYTIEELIFIHEISNAKVDQSSDQDERFHDAVAETQNQDEDWLG
jgi:hypothetical protein